MGSSNAAQGVIATELNLTKGVGAGVLFRAHWGAAGPDPVHDDAGYDLAELERRLGWPAVMELGCRFVIGDPGRGLWRWCGGKLMPGMSWCAMHAASIFDRRPKGERQWEAQRAVAWKKPGDEPTWC